jgi:hypothetical protein
MGWLTRFEGLTMKVFNRENWDAANERLTYFLRELADDGYPDNLIADVRWQRVWFSSTKSSAVRRLSGTYADSR